MRWRPGVRRPRFGRLLATLLVTLGAVPAVAQPTAASPGGASGSTVDAQGLLQQGTGRPLSLAEALRLSLRRAPEVRQATAALQQARAAADGALAALVPEVELNARYTRINNIEFASDTLPYFRDRYLLGLGVRVPVLALLASRIAMLQAQKARVALARAERVAERQAVALTALEAYFTLARAQALTRLARLQRAQALQLQQHVAAAVAGGRLARPELLRAEAHHAASQSRLARAQAAEAVARRALVLFTGLDKTQRFALTTSVRVAPPNQAEDIATLRRMATQQRPELKALRVELKALRADLQAVIRRHLPELALVGNVAAVNPNLQVLPNRDEFTAAWDLGLQARYSASAAWRQQTEVRQAQAALSQVKARYTQAWRAVQLEVEQSWQGRQAAARAWRAAQRSEQAAEASYRARQQRFRAGAERMDAVILAEAEVAAARARLIEAAVARHQQWARLQQATGATLTVPLPAQPNKAPLAPWSPLPHGGPGADLPRIPPARPPW
ncbi:MAG: TolC family protein [Polyangiales bacterium]